MKRYVVFSDVHGDKKALTKIQSASKGADGVFFAGDGYSMLKGLQVNEIYAVGGNCDLGGAPEIVTEIEGVKILLTHGHKYGVKSSLLSITLRAAELGCQVVVFGHTHQKLCCYEYGVFLLNPGASSDKHPPSYAVLTLDNQTFKAEIFPL